MLAEHECRCFGHGCGSREQCLRFKDWKGGLNTPRVARMCKRDSDDHEHFIAMDADDASTEHPVATDHDAAMREAGHKHSDFAIRDHNIY